MGLGTPVFTSFLERKDLYSGGSSHIELICHAGIAKSALLASQLDELQYMYSLGTDLAKKVIPRFYRDDLMFFENGYPLDNKYAGRPGTILSEDSWEQGLVDTWYLFNNLYKTLEIVEITSDETLLEHVQKAVSTCIELAHKVDYVFPLFVEIGTGKMHGTALNVSVLGMYSLIMTKATAVLRNNTQQWIEEAINAIRIMRRFSINMFFHEPQQLAWSAKAANNLRKVVSEEPYKSWRDDFMNLLLMTMYRTEECCGLFQACGGLMYPAFRENVECIEPIMEWIDESELPLRHIVQLTLYNSERMIITEGSTKGLPKEGLHTIECKEAGEIGTAIYSAGSVFDLARIQLTYFSAPTQS